MFTLKLYANNGWRQRIVEVESFTIIRNGSAYPGTVKKSEHDARVEITAHYKGDYSERFDIGIDAVEDGILADGLRMNYSEAIIENAAGKTTEIIR